MSLYRYTLAPYTRGSKVTCPSCGHKRRYRVYLDRKTGLYLGGNYGICDRENKCGYRMSPFDELPEGGSIRLDAKLVHPDVVIPIDDGTFNTVPKMLLEKSLEKQYQDNLSIFLIKVFGEEKAKKALSLYDVGYSKLFNGNSTVFWQIDVDFNIRTGKIFKYGLDGKRDKEGYPKITWVHTHFKGDYNLKLCFFGSQLLPKFPNKKVMIVESEKTAIIMSIVRPQYIWLASTLLNGLADEKLKTLDGRDVTLIPDKSAYEKWKKKADKYLDNQIKVSTFVEELETLESGDDIADYILNLENQK